MKNYTLTFLFGVAIAIFYSCTDSTTENVQFSQADTLFSAIEDTRFTGVYDTAGYLLLVNTISEKEYTSVSNGLDIDSLRTSLCGNKEEGCVEIVEKYFISKAEGKVTRKGKNLLLSLANGKTTTLQNNDSDSDDFEMYQFEKIDENGYYIVAAFYMESYGYVLINSRNGAMIRTIGKPVLSPNKSNYVAGNYDMMAGFTFNGMELMSQADDSLQSELLFDFSTWGIDELKWKDDSTLYIKQASQLEEETKEEKSYSALRIRRKNQL